MGLRRKVVTIVLISAQLLVLALVWMGLMAWYVKGSEYTYSESLLTELNSQIERGAITVHAPQTTDGPGTQQDVSSLALDLTDAAQSASYGVTSGSRTLTVVAIVIGLVSLVLVAWPRRRDSSPALG